MPKTSLITIFAIAALATVPRIECEDGCATEVYDFIVVGAGSAGGVILSRLTEDPNVKVLALEAGEEPLPGYDVPLNVTQLLFGPMDWDYVTVPQRSCCRAFPNQQVRFNRGKALGGSSSINLMAYTRGNKNDFDNWRRLGNVGWSYNDVLPYFIRLEDYTVPHTRYDSMYHGKGGPITVEVPEYRTPLAAAYQQAFMELGYLETDFNAEFQEGFMIPPANTRNHKRCDTYKGYIHPAMGRSNLRVETKALVTKILFDDGPTKTASGVQYEKNGQICEVRANLEVILSGGSVNSPQLLMLSGIGPKEHLEEKKITVIKDVPGIGQNLQDHMDLILSFPINLSVSLNAERIFSNNDNILMYQNSQTGPLTIPAGNEVTAFVSTDLNPFGGIWPNMEMYMISDHVTRLLQQYLDPAMGSVMPKLEEDFFTNAITIHHPKSRGTITLNSADPHEHPIIDPQYLTHEDDIKVLAEGKGTWLRIVLSQDRRGVRIAFQLAETDALKRYGAQIPEVISPFCNSKQMDEQEYFECLVTTWTTTSWHPVGTCKMGPRTDSMAVVDHRLRVHGVRNLRIVDASIIPVIVTGHTNAVSMMIGEKAADMIKEEYRFQF